LINEGSQIIAICSDITRIKEIERSNQMIKASYFSSVAHELRTPLNSIIPILKLILQLLPDNGMLQDRLLNYLKIVLNSSLHL